jgi:hypothetical protein
MQRFGPVPRLIEHSVVNRRRAVGAALTATTVLLGAVPVAGETIVGRDARTAVALTIYSGQDLALVRESRTVDLESGESTLRFEDVPARLDARTTMLTAEPTGDGFAVLEQSYLFDLSSPQALQERWIGHGVELVETDTRLRTRVTEGTLLSTEGGNVYRIGDRIALGHPGWLFLPPSGDDVFTRPTLRWRVSNTGAAHRTLELSYATGGLSWDADYVVLLGADDAHADVSAWATLANGSGARYDDAAIVLVAGRVNRASSPSRRVVAMEAAPLAAAPPPPPAPEQFSEYYRYAFERHTSLAESETKQLPLLAAQGVGVEKRYEVRGEPYWFRQPMRDRDQRVPVAALLSMANTAPNHLGRDLPAGTARVYQGDAAGGRQLVGEDRLRQAAKDETVELTLGDATDLIATRTQTDFKKIDVEPFDSESAYEVTLRNEKPAAVTIAVRDRIDGDWQVTESSVPARKADAQTLAFDVPVPAKGQTVLRYRVRVGR